MAETISEITVAGAVRRVFHRELLLIAAKDASEAYDRARAWGVEGETTYQNPEGKQVKVKFIGVARLDGVIENIKVEDTGEAMYLTFEELRGVQADSVRKQIPRKMSLAAFRRPQIPNPDYRAQSSLELGKLLDDEVG